TDANGPRHVATLVTREPRPRCSGQRSGTTGGSIVIQSMPHVGIVHSRLPMLPPTVAYASCRPNMSARPSSCHICGKPGSMSRNTHAWPPRCGRCAIAPAMTIVRRLLMADAPSQAEPFGGLDGFEEPVVRVLARRNPVIRPPEPLHREMDPARVEVGEELGGI